MAKDAYSQLSFTLEEYEQLMLNHPDLILNDVDLFRWGLENLFTILDKKRKIVPLILKEAQIRLLNTYFELKLNYTPGEIGVAIIILKSRQQGMTTLIAAICIFEMILRANRETLIVAHEKGKAATKIFNIYKRFLQYFPFSEWDLNKKREGDGFRLHNGSAIDVSFETAIRGVTTDFLHLSEGGFFKNLAKFIGEFEPGMPKEQLSALIIESTAEKANDDFHRMWQEAEAGKGAYSPAFYPWYIDEDNYLEIPDGERDYFIDSLQTREDDEYGNELALFEDYDEISYEHLYKRRKLIDGLPYKLASFKREYPTTPEEAFMGVNRPVFDIPTLRWYEKEQVIDPRAYGEMEIGDEMMSHQQTRFIETGQGIIKIYEGPMPDVVYMMGSDHSEGMNDWNAALIAKQHPYEIVVEMIGYEGYNPIPREFARQMYHLGKWYNEAWICPENNPPGNSVIDQLVNWQYPHMVSEAMIFPEKTGSFRYGWRNEAHSRKAALEVARDTIKTKGVKIPNIKLLRQLEYFVTKTIDGTGRVKDQALRKGEYRALGEDIDQFCDDLVFAFLGLEHCRKALGVPKPNQSYVDTMVDKQGQLWVTETLDIYEEQFGPTPQTPASPNKYNWQDYT